MSGESIRPGSKLKAIILIGVAFHPVIGFINTSAANIIAWFERYREQ